MSKRGTATERGYGYRHQVEKERRRPAVDAGQWDCQELICLMTDRWLQPGMPWDLAHDREHGGYLGPAHERCNRAEGGRWRGAKAKAEAVDRWRL